MQISEYEITPKKESEITKLALTYVDEYVKFLTEKFPYIPNKKLKPKLKYSFTPIKTSLKSHTGIENNGEIYIFLDLSLFPTRTKLAHVEYASIASDSVIGTLNFVSWKKSLAALVAHEVAHAYQMFLVYNVKNNDRKLEKLYEDALKWSKQRSATPNTIFRSHGLLWKFFYSELRKYKVNNW